jgi:hypothetical protein
MGVKKTRARLETLCPPWGQTMMGQTTLGQSQVRQRKNLGPHLPTSSRTADAMVSALATPDCRPWRTVCVLTSFRKTQTASIPSLAKVAVTRSQK